MARAALDWGVRDLAQIAGVSANTVARFENGRNAPNPSTLRVIRQAFEATGVRFTELGVEPPPEKEGRVMTGAPNRGSQARGDQPSDKNSG